MKRKTTAILFAISFVLFLIELFFHVDLIVLLFSSHETIFDIMLPVFIFTGIGLAVDYVHYLLLKKDEEKNKLYRETVFGMNHLVRSLQSKFVMIMDSEVVQQEFGNDLVELLQQSTHDIEEILNKLTMLSKADSEIVRNILETPSHCDICGCERLHLNTSKIPVHS